MRLNQWSFRGQLLNSPNVRIRKMTGPFSLPPIRGEDFLTMGRTGRLFVPKLHDSRRISLEIIVRDVPVGVTQGIFDQFALWAANRTQGALANILDSGARTAQAECVGWMPQDITVGGLTHVGVADFQLADPWFYGPTVTGSVVPNAGLAFGTPGGSNISGPRTTWSVSLTGVVSGQPIILAHAVCGTNTLLISVADTFSTPYTWTVIDSNAAYGALAVRLLIGWGGVGTSGTVTVTAPSGSIGGVAIPMTGASTSAGIGAIDNYGNAYAPSGYYAGMVPPLTPAAAGEGALYAVLGTYPYSAGGPLVGVTAHTAISQYGTTVLTLSRVANPPAGVALGGLWYLNGLPYLVSVGCLVKGSGVPVALNVTNPGNVLAEKLTLDFLGPIINPTITNTTNGTSITVNVTVASTKHLIVDTGAFTALNDGSNVIGSVGHSGAAPFLTLNPGVNVLQISGAGCTGDTLVTVSLAPPYV